MVPMVGPTTAQRLTVSQRSKTLTIGPPLRKGLLDRRCGSIWDPAIPTHPSSRDVGPASRLTPTPVSPGCTSSSSLCKGRSLWEPTPSRGTRTMPRRPPSVSPPTAADAAGATGRRVCVTDRASPVVCAGLLPARPSGGAHVALVLLDAATFFCGRRVEYSRRRLCANWCACPHPVTLGRAVARGVLAMALPSTPASVSYRADSSAPLLDIWWLQGLPVPLGALCVLGLSRRPPVTLPVHWCRARHHSKAAALSCPLVT